MSPLSSIALSGMNAASLRVAASGHNVANALTPAFHAQRVATAAAPGGGVAASLERAASPGVSPAGEWVEQRLALYQFKAGARVLQTQDTMLGALLDLRA